MVEITHPAGSCGTGWRSPLSAGRSRGRFHPRHPTAAEQEKEAHAPGLEARQAPFPPRLPLPRPEGP